MPRIIAAFAYRYEPDWMIDQLKENLSWVDDFAAVNDRERTELWGNTKERTKRIMRLARNMGADWVFYTAPDERLEDGAGPILRALAERGEGRYSLRLRELWTPDSYRTDTVWGHRWRKRFYKLDDLSDVVKIDVNLYHLKMIEAENRVERARVHTAANTWDNKTLGFDYMLDETDMTLETIPEGRGFTPAYRPYRFDVG